MEETQTTAKGDQNLEFVPVEGGGEGASAGALLVTAYMVIWTLVFFFIWRTLKRQTALDRRIDELAADLKK